jgi:hypothetical protein
MQDPVLHGRGDLRNPCNRLGPLSLDYYWLAMVAFVATIRSEFSN